MNRENVKRILMVNPFGIGDVLFTTPMIRSLRAAFPQATLGYVCNRRVEELVRGNPHLDLIFIFEKDEYRDLWKRSKKECLRRFIRLLKEIRHQRFGVLIDLSLGWQYSFLGWLLGIPVRVGFNYRRRGRFLTKSKILEGFEEKHVVSYYLELLGFLEVAPVRPPHLEFYTPEKDRMWARDFLSVHEIPEETVLIGISPGGGASWGKEASYKQWPAGHFSKLANRLLEKEERSLLFFGDKKEIPLCEAIAKEVSGRRVVAAGRTSLGQLSALVERCRLLICNDGGTLHLAVSQGVPTLSFFGPVDPLVYGPFPEAGRHRILTIPLCCRPCYRRFKYPFCERQVCLEWLTPEEALREALSLLEGSFVGGQKER